MERKNIAAFTPPGLSYPPYLSINTENGNIEIAVRAPPKSDGSCGETATITLSHKQFGEIILASVVYLRADPKDIDPNWAIT